MRTFDFAPDAGRQITAFGSHGVILSPVVRSETLHVVALHLQPGGMVARHPAADVQLLLVVDGTGTVTGADPSQVVPVAPGTAILWDRGEEHETRAGPGGLHAIIVEGPGLNECDRVRTSRGGTDDQGIPFPSGPG